MIAELLKTSTLYYNPHYLSRYLKFISTRKNVKIKYKTHLHHILPKAKDFFPQYKDLKEHKWNGIYLTTREHFIAHLLLHKSFPGSSQTIAFYNMSNVAGKRNSKAYAEARSTHIKSLEKLHSSPERNAKIGNFWRGRKRPTVSEKLTGHTVSKETREKLRVANIGKSVSEETRRKISQASKGKTLGPCSDERKKNISKSRKGFRPFNNGTEVKLFRGEAPFGWMPGYGGLRKTK